MVDHLDAHQAGRAATVLLLPLASARARHAGDKEEGEETDRHRRDRQHTDSQCCWVALMAGRPPAARKGKLARCRDPGLDPRGEAGKEAAEGKKQVTK